jgi:hypothetical protein
MEDQVCALNPVIDLLWSLWLNVRIGTFGFFNALILRLRSTSWCCVN